MIRKVRFAPEAINDLTEIYDYIAPRGGNRVAEGYVNQLYDFCVSLGEFSERGLRRDDVWPGLRIVGFERRATIAFEVTSDEVRIIRVFGRGRDVERELLP